MHNDGVPVLEVLQSLKGYQIPLLSGINFTKKVFEISRTFFVKIFYKEIQSRKFEFTL